MKALKLTESRALMNTLKHRRYYPGGGYSWEFLLRVCRQVLRILTLFQTKKCNLPALFSDQASRIHTRFQIWPLGRNCVIITLIRAQNNKNSLTPFQIRMFLCLSYSFGIETINTFINCRSSLENHTRRQTKMGKVNTGFLTKTAQKPYPVGRDIPI